MAVVSRVPALTQMDSLRLHDIRVPDIMASRRESLEVPVVCLMEDLVYVAVGKKVKENKLTLLWALQNSGGKRICIIHVHQPAQMIPCMGTVFPESSLEKQEVMAYRKRESEIMHKMLNEYLDICRKMGVNAEKLYTKKDSIEEGIVELISQNGIQKLVMGAAADKSYSRKMMELKSKKAINVRTQAPVSCRIWFVCKGHLIHTREASSDVPSPGVSSLSLQGSLRSETGQSNHLRLHLGPNSKRNLTNPVQDLFHKMTSFSGNGGSAHSLSSSDGSGGSTTPQSRLDVEGSYDEGDNFFRRTTSQCSGLSTSSSVRVLDMSLVSYVEAEGTANGLELSEILQPKDLPQSSPPSVLDGSVDDNLYEQLEQAMTEAENARREAFGESVKRRKAEKDAIEAIRRVKASESLYTGELRQRKEMEEALAKEREELIKMKNQRDEVMEELRLAMDQKYIMENQIAESDLMVQELEQKIISAVELLQNYKKERDELQIERDNALKEAEELRRIRVGSSSTHLPQFFSEFSFAEVDEATRNFDQSMKIGEGGYGNIYKGILRQTPVAVKMLHSHSSQGPSEFQQEVDVLSKMRHPNIVTLIGTCPEAWTLVYEYLPNGSLEDRLVCKDNTPPLSWQTRIRIATELCSALVFLHSCTPHSRVHGDLKPANILLDANFVSKLGDFGLCRPVSLDEHSTIETTICCRTDPKGTFAYMDPEFLATGELTPKSDTYSFGIILLRLLTGRPALGITKEVQYALDTGNLKSLLDPLAGDWPFVQAEQLAHLAMRCSEMRRRARPDLDTEVWRILESMRASCGGSSSLRLGSEERCQAPAYFICPIFQEVMQDPQVAADGFTYEAEALKGWLDSGHDTSPMTNIKLTHCNLVPNHALRSAIREWLEKH